MFTAPRYYNKDYCTAICRRSSKRGRERTRDAAPLSTAASEYVTQFLTTLNNPTVQQLDSWERALANYPIDDKPILITGVVPMWTPTQHVKMVAQPDGTWIMVKWEPSPLETLLSQ